MECTTDNTPVDNTPEDNTPVDNTPVDNTPMSWILYNFVPSTLPQFNLLCLTTWLHTTLYVIEQVLCSEWKMDQCLPGTHWLCFKELNSVRGEI